VEGENLIVTRLAGHIAITHAKLSSIINGHAGGAGAVDRCLHQTLGILTSPRCAYRSLRRM